MPLPPNQKDYYSYPEVTAPNFSKWRAAGAKALVTGFVQSRVRRAADLRLLRLRRRQGPRARAQGLRRRAAATGAAPRINAPVSPTPRSPARPGMFDTRIAYVAESGGGDARTKRIAIMDSDGFNHRYLTAGDTIVLTPRLSPKAARLAYVSFAGGDPARAAGRHRLGQAATAGRRRDAMSFAPRFSPDGNRIVFSMMLGANSDIYIVGADGGLPQRLTTSPGIDTDPSFSPDGSKIVFESDRVGLAAALCDERRRLEPAAHHLRRRLVCGARMEPRRRVDRLHPPRLRRPAHRHHQAPTAAASGSLTAGPADEGPSWAASSRELRVPAHRRARAHRHLPAVARRRRAAQDDNSAGRLRPRLVGS